jgi:hypothetical protein
MHLRLAAVVLLGVVAVTPRVSADFAESDASDYEPPPTERRGGFSFGFSLGPGLSSVAGYRNDLNEIGDPAFERTVDALGVGGSLWLGGALRDWLNLGVGASFRNAQQDDLVSQNSAFVFRVEGFPLFSLGGRARDIGVFGEFGAGGAEIVDADMEVVADGGILSVIGLGVFYEPWRFWHFSTGPLLQYTHEFSPSLTSHAVTLGLRTALYGVQPD